MIIPKQPFHFIFKKKTLPSQTKKQNQMQELHQDKPRYFEVQYLNSKESILPFLAEEFTTFDGKNILEIGSAEGGVLKAFVEKGSKCMGIELSENRTKLAFEFQKEEVEKGNINFIAKDIYDIDENGLGTKYDLVILKDVIEHIHDQKKFMKEVSKFLTPNGVIFFGFPSWRMPYGGHQQTAKSKFASKMPYYHILPKGMYKAILKISGESKEMIEGLLEVKETRISTKRFERLCHENNFEIKKRTKYFIAPIYKYKFGFTPRLLWKWVGAIPFFNDFFTFQSYYVIGKK